ncbi:MAG: hypothetical protein JRE57_02920 [Deltaproteobacteria bacterium]|nr:hypothetical protein [Deltaproteobacteria bacterium]
MSIRPELRRGAAAAMVCVFSIIALAAPALGQPAAQQPQKNRDKLAWLGCWDVIPDPDAEIQERPEERQMICVAPGDDPESLDMTVLIDNENIATETIVPNGSRHPVSDGGCDGWIRSVLSEDRRRLYLQSEATCPDGKLRNLTGASMIAPGNRWIDIHALRVDGERELLIQRYQPVEAGTVRLPGVFSTEMDIVRMAAVAPLTVDNVIEALQVVDPAVVEAMLLESEVRFGIDSDLLLQLADAGVPGEVIDLMVALTFPDYFSIEGGTVSRQAEVYYGGGYWSPWYPYYGYGHYYHHRYSHHDRNRGGKVVSGRGYVSVRQTGNPSGGFTGLFQGGSGGGGFGGGSSGGNNSGNGGSASGSGFKSGDSPTTRPAVPK